ncbi:hypothetical protein C8R44DRAFT_738871 [Mycena epipterygia]|nr:hypothetical protein C8R44DRAFT_738871 [Mycena epipterygia]
MKDVPITIAALPCDHSRIGWVALAPERVADALIGRVGRGCHDEVEGVAHGVSLRSLLGDYVRRNSAEHYMRWWLSASTEGAGLRMWAHRRTRPSATVSEGNSNGVRLGMEDGIMDQRLKGHCLTQASARVTEGP